MYFSKANDVDGYVNEATVTLQAKYSRMNTQLS